MKKRLLLILIIGISFTPAVFADSGDPDLRKDEAVAHQVAMRPQTVGEMSDEYLEHGSPSLMGCPWAAAIAKGKFHSVGSTLPAHHEENSVNSALSARR